MQRVKRLLFFALTRHFLSQIYAATVPKNFLELLSRAVFRLFFILGKKFGEALRVKRCAANFIDRVAKMGMMFSTIGSENTRNHGTGVGMKK